MANLNSVVLVGRTNVGKSTLFNRLSTSVKALTLDQEGVTRDFIKDTVAWRDKSFELMDTGGVSFRKTQDPILEKVREVALNLVEKADIALLVCDGTVGVVPEDREIAKLLHKLRKKVIVVVNKIDTKLAQEQLHEFQTLGFEHVIAVSAQHSVGIGDLLDVIVDELGEATIHVEEEKPRYRVALLGKPNVGKSSLLNLLLKKERAIVADVPGTTREPLKEKIKFYKETIELVDTAGVRRKKAVKEDIEEMMVKSSLHAVREADIILLLIDASEAELSDQELKLAFYVFEQGKALILLFNKQDITTDFDKQDLKQELEKYEYFLKKLERLNISCKTGKNIGQIVPLIDSVWKKYSQQFSDIELTDLFKRELKRRPLYHKTSPLILYSAKQLETAPITIMLRVNESDWFGPSQLAFFENVLRENYDLRSVPVLFVLKKRSQKL